MYNVPNARISEATREKRYKWVLTYGDLLTPDNVIYVDETSFNMTMSRGRGRSEKGVRAVAQRKVMKNNAISVCAAVSPTEGIIDFRIREKIKKEDVGKRLSCNFFKDFIENLIEKHIPNTPHYIIADNCNQHSAKDLNAMILENQPVTEIRDELPPNIQFVFLPPYSPELNPIEQSFNVWKAHIKTLDALSTDDLQQAIAYYCTNITAESVANQFAHMQREIYPLVLAHKDIVLQKRHKRKIIEIE